MHRRKSFFLIVAVVIILVAGFFTYSQYQDKTTQQDNAAKKSTQKSPETPQPAQSNSNASKNEDVPIKKTPIAQSNPQEGEIFVQGKVKSVDAEKRIITIIQLMDDNSQSVNPNVPVSKDAIIQDKNSDIAITQIKNGDVVGMIVTSDGQARAVLVNY